MFGALKCGFQSTASLMLVRNVVGELQPKRTLAASRGFLAAARLSCCIYVSSLYVLWVASIVDLRVFWQPGSVLFVLNCRDYSLFESNKFLLLLLLLLLLLCAPAR